MCLFAVVMKINKPVRGVFNTKPFLFRKTGIGYYTYNLLNGMLQSKDVVIYPTIDNPSTNTLRFMSSVSQAVRKVLENSMSEDFLQKAARKSS